MTGRVFLGGDDFEVTASDGRISLTGYGWSGPESLTPADARCAAAVLAEAADHVVSKARRRPRLIDFPCSECNATPGEPCVSWTLRPTSAHVDRRRNYYEGKPVPRTDVNP